MSSVTDVDAVSLPCDDRAENAVINYAQTYPERIVDLGLVPGDFYNMKRRRLWQSMLTVIVDNPDVAGPAAFYLLVVQSVTANKDHRVALSAIDGSVDWIESVCVPNAPIHGIDHFVERIRVCTDARRLIDAAHQITEKAFRVPEQRFTVTDASVVLTRVVGSPIKRELGIEIPSL